MVKRTAPHRPRLYPGVLGAFTATVGLIWALPSGAQEIVAHWTEIDRFQELDGITFTKIADVAAHRDSIIFILQPQDGRVLRYELASGNLSHFGGRGGGPGEMVEPVSLQLIGDSLLVYDPDQARLSIFSLEGDFLDSQPAFVAPGSGARFGVAPRLGLSDGSFVVFQHPAAVQDSIQRGWRITPEGSARPYARAFIGGRHASLRHGIIKASLPRPVNGSSLVAPRSSGQGLVVVDRPLPRSSDSSYFTVRQLDQNGDTVLQTTYRYQPRGIPERVRDDMASQHAAELIARFDDLLPVSDTELEEAFAEALAIPPFQAPVDRVVAAGNGAIWLRQGSLGLKDATWWILRQGLVDSVVRLPADYEVLEICCGGSVWIRSVGPLDEPTLIRIRVTGQDPSE